MRQIYVELQQATSIYGGYLIRKREREEEAKRDQESRRATCASITPTPCPLPGLRREEAITATHSVDSF